MQELAPPTNLYAEPPYPDHETVLISMAHPDWTAHAPTRLCQTQEPHLIVECKEWSAS